MNSGQFHDFLRAIRQRDARALVALMFDQTTWVLRPGFLCETEAWDYKICAPEPGTGSAMEWAELCKDILSFHNHNGGAIVIGVDNAYRVVRSRNTLDSKLVVDKVRRYLGDSIWVDYHRLSIQADQKHIGIILVPPRGPVIARFVRDSPMEGTKQLFKKGDTAFREGDSSKVLHGVSAESFVAQSRTPFRTRVS
ncbi:MAG TPA: RNA-binding domain-containing protein, partial [Verrucomicrobiae bacterium]|nr:RNA-binding domain-containing protein [Verrucomicrobiae bacterium]